MNELCMDIPFTAGPLSWTTGAEGNFVKLCVNSFLFQSVLSVFFFSIGSTILSWAEGRMYTCQQSSWQPVVYGCVVRTESISEDFVWIKPEFIFLPKSILYFWKWKNPCKFKC